MEEKITTVAQLIEFLQQFDPNLELELACGGGYYTQAYLESKNITEEDGKLVIEV